MWLSHYARSSKVIDISRFYVLSRIEGGNAKRNLCHLSLHLTFWYWTYNFPFNLLPFLSGVLGRESCDLQVLLTVLNCDLFIRGSRLCIY